MYVKGKPPIVPSDAQSKEKLAIHVYEYLIHIGAQKSANSFLQEIRWDKPIPIGEPPGFLHSWWSVFWDLYSAAPERRDNHDHSNEAKAFHDYGFVNSGFTNGMPHPNHPGMPQGPSGPMGPPNPMDCGQPPMLRGQPSGNNPGNQPPRGLVMSPMHPHHPGMRFPPGMHPGMRPGPPAQRWPPVVVGGGGPSGHPGGHSMVGPIPPNQGPPSGHPGLPPHPSNPQNMPNNPHLSQSNQIVPSPGHPITPGSNNGGGGNQPPGTHPMMLPPSPNTNPDVFNSQQPNSNSQQLNNNMPPGSNNNNQNSNTPPTHGNISGSPYAANRPSPHIDGFNNLNNNPNVNNNGNNNNNGPNSDNNNMMNNPMNGRMMPPPPNNDYMDSLKASPHLNINNSSDQQIPNNPNSNSNPNDFVNGQGSLPTSQQMDSNNYSNSNTPNSNNGPQSSSQPPPTSASQNGVPSVQFPHEYSFNPIT